MRSCTLIRNTKETQIHLMLTLDQLGNGGCTGSSGIGFFDHMLHSFCVHGGFLLELKMQGDLEVDCHHTIEDVGITLGKAFAEILGERKGIARYGMSSVPMDESLSTAILDISGRPYLVYNGKSYAPQIGAYDTQMTKEFFRALAYNMGMTLHIQCVYGENDHHIVESIYKAVARAIREAVTPTAYGVLSAKGVL